MTESTQTVAVPRQDEVTVIVDGDYVTLHQEDTTGEGRHADIEIHRTNIAALILALRRLKAGEV